MKNRLILVSVVVINLMISISSVQAAEIKLTTYEITDIELIAENSYTWYDFPVEALFIHSATGTEIRVWGFWNGGKRWIIRFCPNLDGAIRLAAYLMNRYGAYSGLVAAGGEYQYAFTSCGWDEESYNKIGSEMQKYNSYGKPISLHPSSSTERWTAKHNVQSSRAYHNSSWLDHNWIQSGQWPSRLFNIPLRSLELFNLEPAKPVYLSEALYERGNIPDHIYLTRWQPWSAFLNGACGFCYGADGVYGFTDPYDPGGETGMESGYEPWWESIALEGSSQMHFARDLLTTFQWWKLNPSRDKLLLNGKENPMPTDKDISPPHCASIPGELFIIYIPRGNNGNKIEIKDIPGTICNITWFNPRSGGRFGNKKVSIIEGTCLIPERPVPADEDWVLIINNFR